MAPWRLRKCLLHIERLREKLNDWKIQHVNREANQRADALAKEGVDRQSDSLRVFLETGPRWIAVFLIAGMRVLSAFGSLQTGVELNGGKEFLFLSFWVLDGFGTLFFVMLDYWNWQRCLYRFSGKV
ncbi:Uncharacterized protein TCM_036783 [Theobroma cacao]|uniref:RNase H type-1 domain-containing protein n=1 Tax=Theobroma cacao TaxID=3641 RepID=A0A061GPX4_THECC|nr:Uncharacterized protein TCM_036783 [Theobroma cacao]